MPAGTEHIALDTRRQPETQNSPPQESFFFSRESKYVCMGVRSVAISTLYSIVIGEFWGRISHLRRTSVVWPFRSGRACEAPIPRPNVKGVLGVRALIDLAEASWSTTHELQPPTIDTWDGCWHEPQVARLALEALLRVSVVYD